MGKAQVLNYYYYYYICSLGFRKSTNTDQIHNYSNVGNFQEKHILSITSYVIIVKVNLLPYVATACQEKEPSQGL